MRILLVTRTAYLFGKLSALNPELEYGAIIVDEVTLAKETLKKAGLSEDLLYSMDDLQKCVGNLHYDYVVCAEDKWWKYSLAKTVEKYSVPRDKILNFCKLHSGMNFLLERSFRYFKEHVNEFEIFATGISTVEKGIDPAKFKRKLFNFGRGSQDLYYNFRVAKFAVSCGGGHNKIRYALIGLTPYSFHHDLSRTLKFKYMMLQYFITFKDLHNFFVPFEIYKKFFREKFLEKKLTLKDFDVNVPYGSGTKWESVMSEPLVSNLGINTWEGKYYPETRDENIKILDDYLTFCEENNIRPILFTVPVTEKYIQTFNKQLMDEFYVLVEEACQRHPGAKFVDGWKWNGVTYDDFHDHEHLTVQGAAKFSAYLNDFIESLETN